MRSDLVNKQRRGLIKKELLLFAVLPSILLSLPFLIWPYPPFQDLANHLLEGRILAFPAEYERWFTVVWQPAPNLTTQILAGMLQRFLPMPFTGALIGVLIVVTFVFGAYFALRELFVYNGAVRLIPLLWVWNFFFWRGYLNFSFGCGLFFWGVYLYHKSCTMSTIKAAAILSGWSLLMYFTHIFPWALWISWIVVHDLAAKRFPKWSTVLAASCALIPFAVYAHVSGDTDSTWHYGTGIWKLAVLKRTIGIPFVSCLQGAGIVTALTVENVFRYLLLVAALVHVSLNYRKIPIARRWWYVAWLTAYLILPTNRGDVEVDTRVLFLPLVLILCESVALFDRKGWRARLAYAVLGGVLVMHVVLTWSQFGLGSNEIVDRMSHEPATEINGPFAHAFPVFVTTTATLDRSTLHRALEKIKLHTDNGQMNVCDLHITCYLYEDVQNAPSYPPDLFEFSVLKFRKKVEP